MPFDPALFRQVLGRFATGVTVVTTCKGDSKHGMTANAFSSVSLDPPLILVSVDKKADMHGWLEESGVFCVNLLPEHRREWSDWWAGKAPKDGDQFADIPARRARKTGSPVLDELPRLHRLHGVGALRGRRPHPVRRRGAGGGGQRGRRACGRCSSTPAGTASCRRKKVRAPAAAPGRNGPDGGHVRADGSAARACAASVGRFARRELRWRAARLDAAPPGSVDADLLALCCRRGPALRAAAPAITAAPWTASSAAIAS